MSLFFDNQHEEEYELALERVKSNGSLEGGYPESRVLLIATGGTICMVRSERGYVPAHGFLEKCLSIRPSFNDRSNPPPIPVAVLKNDDSYSATIKYLPSLRTPLSAYNRHVRYTCMEFEPLLDSSSINAKGWTKIAKAIEKNYTLFDAFVVLHGTDSLAYTCSAVSFMLSNLGKPVIFTGSQAPMSELRTDATDNLLGSMILAGHFMIAEVCLFFNNALYRGNRTTKVSANDFNAFTSANHPPLGKVGINIKIHWHLITRPSTISPFKVQTHFPDTSHVACLRIFPGIQPAMVDSVLKMPGLRGLILETFGSGNAPEDDRLFEVLRNGVESGIVVVAVTQCMIGSVSPLYAPGTALVKAGVVFGLDMTTEAALTKLSCLLADPELSVDEVRNLMSQNLRGELTETAGTAFSHPEAPVKTSELPAKLTLLSELGYAVAKADRTQIYRILEMSREWLLNEYDYTGNTPVHLAAVCPDVSILRAFLSQGASVHLRNREGKTPVFLAAEAGLPANVELLRKSGGHLHAEELTLACNLRRLAEDGVALGIGGVGLMGEEVEEGRRSPGPKVRAKCWELAGATMV